MTDIIPWGPEHPKFPECPVPPGTDCTIWTRGGNTTRDRYPQGWRWNHYDMGGDIIAYQPHTAAEQSDLLAAISTLRDTLQTALKLVDAIHEVKRNESNGN